MTCCGDPLNCPYEEPPASCTTAPDDETVLTLLTPEEYAALEVAAYPEALDLARGHKDLVTKPLLKCVMLQRLMALRRNGHASPP